MTSTNVISVEITPHENETPSSRRASAISSSPDDQQHSVLERFGISLDKPSFAPGEKVTGAVSLVVATDDDNGDVTGRLRGSGRMSSGAGTRKRVYLRVKSLWLDFNVFCDMVLADGRRKSTSSSRKASSVGQEVMNLLGISEHVSGTDRK